MKSRSQGNDIGGERATSPLTLLAGLAVAVYTLPFTLPALRCYFSQDHVFNILLYANVPPLKILASNITFWTTFHRPFGGLVYVALYHLFGMTAWPYYLAALLLFFINLALVFTLLLRLTGDRLVASLATALSSVHPELVDIWYNFGAAYDLLALGLMMGGFHFYLSFDRQTDPHRARRFYAASLFMYVLALDSKEAAISLVAILGLYECVYRFPLQWPWTRLGELARRLGPFAVVAAAYAAGKLLGAEATWKRHEDYQYRLDGTILENLPGYFDRVVNYHFRFDASLLAGLVVVSLVLALILRNRAMLFGWFYFWVALAPVAGLPRPWGLYLYIPLVGIGLYLGALVCAVLPRTLRKRRLFDAVVLLLFLVGLTSLHHGALQAVAIRRFLEPALERHSYVRQLFTLYPDLPGDTALFIRRSPFVDDWALHSAVWLHYRKPGISVLQGPDARPADFPNLGRQCTQYRVVAYQQGRVYEVERGKLAAGELPR
ncbi:MAG: hypothetical protein ACR2L2_19910 [Acidobacteriota bacterium]